MERRHLLAGLAAAPLLSLPALAQGPRLSFGTWQAQEPGFGDWWREMIPGFESATGIRVESQSIPFRDYLQQMTVRFASGRPPEVMILPAIGYGALVDQGWIEPLEERIAGTPVATEWTPLQADMRWNGRAHGVLLLSYGYLLFYNEKLLADAGLSPPRDFAGFRAAAARVTDRDKGIFGLSAVTVEHPTIVLDFMRSITWAGQEAIRDGRYNLADPAVAEAVELYRQTVGRNSALGQNSNVARQLFLDGKSAFLIDGSWVLAWLQRAPAEVRPHLKVMAAPFAPRLGAPGFGIHVAAAAPREAKDRAWRFIQHLTTPEAQRRFAVLTSSAPARRGVLTAAEREALPAVDMIEQAATGIRPTVPNIQAIRGNYNEFSAAIQRAALRVLSTAEPAAQILRQTQAELQRSVPL